MAHQDRPALSIAAPEPLTPPPDLAARLSAIDAPLPPAKVALLGDYLARLLAMNERMNLTAIDDPAEAWERHVLDALSLVPHLRTLGAGATLVDVGSGGGIPGIPLAIARPELSITLVDSTQKKAAFLADLVRALSLPRVSVRAERAERLRLERGADVVTARAVARLITLVPLLAPLVRPGGRMLLIKGQRAAEELAEVARSLRALRLVHEGTVPTPTGKIVILQKGAGR